MQGTPKEEPEYPPAIDLRELGQIDGTVVGFDQAPSKFAANTTIVRLKDSKTGTVGSLWLSATVLRSEFARLRPKIGERVAVSYLGMVDGANGSYHKYRVTAPDRPPFVPDWDALDGDAEEDFDYSTGPPLDQVG